MKSLVAVLVLCCSLPCWGEIAVFNDGRILKVEDAYIDGDRIVLVLPGNARILVPATRIDRVVADEVSPITDQQEKAPAPCAFAWSDHALPADTPYAGLIGRAARQADIHPALLAALVRAESAFDPRARSRVGAAGLTQLMPGTAADRGVENVWDPADNLSGGARHLRLLLDRFESLPLALAAYNAGATTVTRYQGIPPYRETRNYVRRIMNDFCGPSPM